VLLLHYAGCDEHAIIFKRKGKERKGEKKRKKKQNIIKDEMTMRLDDLLLNFLTVLFHSSGDAK